MLSGSQLFSIVCVVSALFYHGAFAQTLDPFTLGAFTETATFSVANQLGFFLDQDLNVTFFVVPNSTFAYSTLLDGGFDLVIGTADNPVNLRFNSNDSLSIVGQLDLGPDIVISGIPNIASILDLKGKALMVDSPVSGYAFILRDVLSLHGLQFGTDYTFQVIGSIPSRFEALNNGSLPDGTPVFATILTYPFTVQAAALSPPLPILARISDFIAPFFSSSLAIRTASTNSSASTPLVRTVAALLAANRFLADPTNQACATAAIAAELGVPPAQAAAEYASATDPVSGEVSQTDFEVGRQALLNVISVRMLSAGFSGAGPSFDFADAIVPGDGALIDYRVRDAALGILKTKSSADGCPLISGIA
ncbi:hypothetical protein EWM64_g10324 [Hericium alpestre]|uniref:SsuA/THI5-like domain-containing protein n=1 Tax=Hericium alpestre TaxID=135208 RepID=A0A4Y9ZJ49_9AGAM|nr:hypothetical protein EWM64_g10324 [Hericium alpestre]